jgi:PAS domain S-box-containing protein
MVLSQKITVQIRDALQKNPQGLSITGIVNSVKINRNTAGRYLESLLASGQVEMRHFGMAKIYTLSHRVPLSAVLSISSDLILQLDSDLRIMYANEPFVSFLGTTQKDLFGKNIQYSVLVPIFDDLFEPFMEHVRDGLEGIEWGGEFSLRRQGAIFSCRIAPTAFDNGQKGVSVILEDITRRKEDEKRIQESEELYRSLAESSQDLIFVINAQDRVAYVNSYAAAAIGKPSNEIVNMERSAIFPPEINRRQQEFLHHVFMSGQPFHDKSPLVLQGTMRWFDHFLMPLKSPDGSIWAVLGISRDITEQQKIIEELKRSEEKYRTLVEHSQVGVFIIKGRKILYANEALARMLGTSSKDLILHDFRDFIAPEDRDWVIDRGLCRQRGEIMPESYEFRMLKRDGTTSVYVSLDAGLIQYEDEPASTGTIRDITEQKRAEERLRESEEKFRSFVETSPDIIWEVDLQGNVRYVSPMVTTIMGYLPEEIVGRPIFDLVPGQKQSFLMQELARVNSSEGSVAPMEVPALHRNGRDMILEIRPGRAAGDGKLKEYQGVAVDITERKRAEEGLRQSEDRFRRIFEDGPLAMAILDKDYRFVTVNRRFCEMLGYSVEELQARTFVDITHPAHVDQDLAEVKKLFAGRIATYRTEKRYIRKDGSVIWGSLTVSPLRDKEGYIVSTIALVEDITAQNQSGK